MFPIFTHAVADSFVAPSMQDASTSSNNSSESVASLPSGEITVDLSCSQAPASPNPEASVLSYPHSVTESLDEFSYIVGPDGGRSIEWSADDVEVMKVSRHSRTPTRPPADGAVPMAAASPPSAVAPLSPSLKVNLIVSPDVSIVDRSGSFKSKGSSRVLQDVSAVSIPDSQGRSATANTSTASKDWILEDLLRDGKLDVDAVGGILGLDLGFLDEPTPNNDSIFGNTSQLSESASPARDGMGWGRAALSSSTSFDIQIRKPGGPLCVIPEETEDGG